jgi:hypothetical protein
LTTAHALEAVSAVDGPVAARLEGYLGGLTAVAADDIEELALGTGSAVVGHAAAGVTFALVTSEGATGAAALWFTEAAAGVELLVLGAKDKFLAAVGAGQGLVCERHFRKPLSS